MNQPLLQVEKLKTYFHTRHGVVKAVDGISFEVNNGETLGIVGESGCGKSVTCFSLIGLIPRPPGKIESGRALFDGVDLLSLNRKALNGIRGKRISMIFQDPMTSLNPYLRISTQLTEPLRIHDNLSSGERLKRAIRALDEVGVPDAEQRIHMYPHEFSGGMRQRVMIAMALITRPELLIADEPTTALDVTVQAQILQLIKRLQEERGTAVILITHDLGVVASVSDRILVMYAGRIMEQASSTDLFARPRHPYTQALMQSIPAVREKGETLFTIPGLPPDLVEEMPGCSFVPRCRQAHDACSEGTMNLKSVAEQHTTACRRVQEGEIDV